MASFKSLTEALAYRATSSPAAMAYGFLADDLTIRKTLTYRDLHQQACRWATAIKERVTPGGRVMVALPSGDEFIEAFFGCLYAEAIAVPAHAPKKRALARIIGIATHARPAAIVTTSEGAQSLRAVLAGLGSPCTIMTACPTSTAEEARYFPRADATAFLQYTSGSTGDPKGIRVSHSNILSNQRMIAQCFGHDSSSSILSWLPMQHDMGLIGTVFQPLFLGVPGLFMTPAQFASNPTSWLRAISRYRITTSGGPNSAYDLCVQKDEETPVDELELSDWTVAFCGSEPVEARTLERFTAQFGRCGFRRRSFLPCYGLAEATLFVTGKSWSDEPRMLTFDGTSPDREEFLQPATTDTVRVSCGKEVADAQVCVVDTTTLTALPEGCIGEVWVSGSSVADGYFEAPEESQQTFRATLSNGMGPFLRTGDLGVRLHGELFITGRRKELILLGGRNIHPQDVERVACDVPGTVTGGAVAFLDRSATAEGIGILVEIKLRARRSASRIARELANAAAGALTVPITRVVAVAMGQLPRTTSGKLQRGQAQRLLAEGALKCLGSWPSADAPLSALERDSQESRTTAGDRQLRLYEIISTAARVPIEDLRPQDNLYALGMDSVALLKAGATLRHELGLDLPVELLFENPTLADLETRLRQLPTTPAAQATWSVPRIR